MTMVIMTADYIRGLQAITPAIMARKAVIETAGRPITSRQTIEGLFEAADRFEIVFEGITDRGAYNAVVRRVEYGYDTYPDITVYYLARLE